MPYKNLKSEAAKASNKRRYDRYQAKSSTLRTNRSRHYKNSYGISLERFESMIAAQSGMCPVGPHQFGKGKDSPCLDHNHETGAIRGVLCRSHNSALGLFHDSIEEMSTAIQYLSYWTS